MARQWILDPTLLFMVVFVVPTLFLEDSASGLQFLIHPYNIATVVITFTLTFVAAKGVDSSGASLIEPSQSERRSQFWWLINAILVHFLLGGSIFLTNHWDQLAALVKVNWVIPSFFLHSLYGRVDHRFCFEAATSAGGLAAGAAKSLKSSQASASRLTSPPSATMASVAGVHPVIDLLSLIDLVILFPLCCMMYYGVRRRAPWRAPLQILTASLQLASKVFYIGTGVLETWAQSPSLSDFDLVSHPENLFFIWVPFVLSMVSITVPLILINQAVVELSSIVEVNVGVIPYGPKTFMFSSTAFDKKPAQHSTPRHTPASPDQPPGSSSSSRRKTGFEIRVVPTFHSESSDDGLEFHDEHSGHYSDGDHDDPIVHDLAEAGGEIDPFSLQYGGDNGDDDPFGPDNEPHHDFHSVPHHPHNQHYSRSRGQLEDPDDYHPQHQTSLPLSATVRSAHPIGLTAHSTSLLLSRSSRYQPVPHSSPSKVPSRRGSTSRKTTTKVVAQRYPQVRDESDGSESDEFSTDDIRSLPRRATPRPARVGRKTAK